jgi:hypothetical protein
MTNIPGPAVAQSPTGQQLAQGPPGATGPQGLKGPAGAAGPTGPTGPSGGGGLAIVAQSVDLTSGSGSLSPSQTSIFELKLTGSPSGATTLTLSDGGATGIVNAWISNFTNQNCTVDNGAGKTCVVQAGTRAMLMCTGQSGDGLYAVTSELVDPLIIDGSVITPFSTGGATFAGAGAFMPTPLTTNSATPQTIMTIPLPGTSGLIPGSPDISPPSEGSVVIDVLVTMTSTTTDDAAYFKVTAGWVVHTVGSPVAMGGPTPGAWGTNSDAPPSGWAMSVALDGGSQNALVQVTGDASLTVTHVCRGEATYGQ